MLYELVMYGSYYNQQIVNRFNYVSTGVTASVLGSFALTHAFGAIPDAGVYPAAGLFKTLMNTLSNQFTVTNIVARAAALYDPEDFYERPFPTPYAGGDNNQGLSPALAYGFRTNRVRLDVARGTKRFVGASEGGVDAGGNVSAAQMTVLSTIATKMSDTISYVDEGQTISFAPCVVSKEEYTTPAGNRAYRYYPTLAEQLEHVALGIVWQPYATIRTQTSRQYGRGV